ncbi:hypothetical protein CBR_g22419 [Chara braunii]|uniref:CBS domain-containing protein n=1 Tax=Chara braunii TaxID=69332 RepID=A0A388JUZ7_CHABU|nr:hypothetical protein CBR_g22419 [Chara braunii]|eukprot:GBG61621.1 hypothetical protein CBR_g22419 [Chara braunii]
MEKEAMDTQGDDRIAVDERMEQMLGGGDDGDIEEVLLETGFQKIPVSAFPLPESGRVIEMASDTSIREAVQTLSQYGISSAPVRNVDAAPTDTWMKKYLGVVDFVGIALWVLDKLEEMASVEKEFVQLGGEADDSIYKVVEDMEVFNTTKVSSVTNSFSWGPFLPVTMEDSLLSVLIILSRYNFHRVPVIDIGGDEIRNIITQSSVVRMLGESKGRWFDKVAEKKISELGLPKPKSLKAKKADLGIPFDGNDITDKLGLRNASGSNPKGKCEEEVCVQQDAHILDAFRLMKQYDLHGVPVVDPARRVVGNISAQDISLLLTRQDSSLLPVHRHVSVKEFMNQGSGLDASSEVATTESDKGGPRVMCPPVTCTVDSTLRSVIDKMVKTRVHKVYVVDEERRLVAGISLQDIIGWVVSEPEAGWLSKHMKRLQGIA